VSAREIPSAETRIAGFFKRTLTSECIVGNGGVFRPGLFAPTVSFRTF